MTINEILEKVLKGEIDAENELTPVTQFELAVEIEKRIEELQMLHDDLK